MIYENEIFKTASWRRKVLLSKAFDKKLKFIISTTLRKDQWSPLQVVDCFYFLSITKQLIDGVWQQSIFCGSINSIVCG